MSEPIQDVKHWLKTNGIDYHWALSVASQAKKEYPYLGRALNSVSTNRSELDLVLMIHHLKEGRFPVKAKDKRGARSSV